MVFSHLLQAAALLLVGTLLYTLFFWRSTFLRWNRVLLWSILLASLILPFVHLPESWTLQGWQNKVTTSPLTPRLNADEKLPEPQFFSEIDFSEQETPSETSGVISTKHPVVPITRLLFLLYGLGCLVFGIRFLIHLFSLFKLFRKAHLEQRDGYCLAFCQEELSPFAFGRTIFLSEALLQSEDLELILTHELAHIRQQHTLDILVAELLLVWQWFNPGAWLFRRLVETNLEYLADRSVLQQQWNKKQYQLSLLNWSNVNVNNRLSTSYNFSLLKERIMMMNRKPSSKAYWLRYALMGMLLPLLPLFNFSTSNSEYGAQTKDNHLPFSDLSTLTSLGKMESPAPKDLLDSKKSTLVHEIESKDIEVKPLAIFPKEKTAISLVLVIIGKDITSAEMEALKKIELPFGLDLRFSLNQQGKLKSVTLHSEGAGDCGLAVDDNNPLPLVLTGEIGGCGTQSFNLKLLEKVQKGQIEESTQVLTGGIPLDPNSFEAYKTKIIDLQSNLHQKRLEKLAANNWTEEIEDASDEMRIPLLEDGQKTMTDRMKSCLRAGKELQVYINDGAPQSTIPLLSELKIKKFATHWKSKNYYFKGTTQIEKTEWLGLRVEIFTE